MAACLAATAALVIAFSLSPRQSLAAPLPLPSPSLPVGGNPSPSAPPAAPPPSPAPHPASQGPAGTPARPAAASPGPALAALSGPGDPAAPAGGPSASGSPATAADPRAAAVQPAIPAPVLAVQVAAGLLGALLVLFAALRIWQVQGDRRAYAADPALAELARVLESAREAELATSVAIVAPGQAADPAAQQAVAALLGGSVDPDASLVQRADGSLAAIAPASATELERRLEAVRRRASRHGLDFRYAAVGDDGRSSARRLLDRARPRLG